VAISNKTSEFSSLIFTKKLPSIAVMLTVMSYLGFNHHYRLKNHIWRKDTRSTVLDLLRLSKSTFPIVKELIRRMVELVAGPEYLFCHNAN